MWCDCVTVLFLLLCCFAPRSSLISTPFFQANRLVSVAGEATAATTAMVEISKNVLKSPNSADAKTELSNAARSVGAAIKVTLLASVVLVYLCSFY